MPINTERLLSSIKGEFNEPPFVVAGGQVPNPYA